MLRSSLYIRIHVLSYISYVFHMQSNVAIRTIWQHYIMAFFMLRNILFMI